MEPLELAICRARLEGDVLRAKELLNSMSASELTELSKDIGALWREIEDSLKLKLGRRKHVQ